MKNRVHLLFMELRLCGLRMLVMALVASCLMGLSMTLMDYATSIPKALQTYIVFKAEFEEYEVTCDWMNSDELAFVEREVQEEGLSLEEIKGEKNHIHAKFKANNYEQCIRIVDKISTGDFAISSEAYTAIKRLLDDIRFFRELFWGLAIVSSVAYLVFIICGEAMILLREKTRLRILYYLGWSRYRIWGDQMIRFSLYMIPASLFAKLLGKMYEEHASAILRQLFSDEAALFIPTEGSWIMLGWMLLMTVFGVGLLLLWYLRRVLFSNVERVA